MSVTVDDVAPAVRAELAALWQARAHSESRVGGVFDQLVAELVATGAHPEVIALARQAALDEARHADVCLQLAVAYHGAPIEIALPPPVRLPDHGVAPRLRAALHVTNLCCMSETLAAAFVEACVADCHDAALREIHGRHLADEVRHARIGWAHLGSLDDATRAAIAPYLPELLRAQLHNWESRLAELPEHGIPGHGYPARAALIAVIHTAVREVVLPGFDYVGVDTAAARAWLTLNHIPDSAGAC